MKKITPDQSALKLTELTKQLHDMNERLEHLSSVDSLTGLLNRRGLQDVLTREIPRLRKNGSKLLTLFIDLDDFKRINDTWGFSSGDVLLREIARRLQEPLRRSDRVARIGGDKFIILMPHTAISTGIAIAERIRLLLSSAPISTASHDAVHITASFGMAVVPEGTCSVEELLDQTYLVLQQSKKNGKNQVSCSDHDRQSKRTPPVSELLEALKQADSYHVAVQPIVDILAEEPMGYEFLTRSALKGFELPDDFFHLCMENNVLTLVDHYCLKACLKAASNLPPGVRKHVNLFPSTLINIPVEQLLADMPSKPAGQALCIEISEKQIINDPGSILEPVKTLRNAGVLIAIDDTGFGRTCLESLTLLEPDIIKIDRKCITGIGENKEMLRPLKRLISVAGALNAEIIAEGIETESDRKALLDLGVKHGQGYLWGKPVIKAAADLWPFRRPTNHFKKSA